MPRETYSDSWALYPTCQRAATITYFINLVVVSREWWKETGWWRLRRLSMEFWRKTAERCLQSHTPSLRRKVCDWFRLCAGQTGTGWQVAYRYFQDIPHQGLTRHSFHTTMEISGPLEFSKRRRNWRIIYYTSRSQHTWAGSSYL